MKQTILKAASVIKTPILPGLMTMTILFIAPTLLACGSYDMICCPVAGLGRNVQKDDCPSGYCGRRPSAKLTVDYKGGKLNFCCNGCINKFKKSPEKYAATANHQLVSTHQASQKACPLCGGKFEKSVLVMVAGVRVQFCSRGCADKVAKVKLTDQVNLVFGDQAFARGFVMNGQKSSATSSSSRLQTNQVATGTCCEDQSAPKCCCQANKNQ